MYLLSCHLDHDQPRSAAILQEQAEQFLLEAERITSADVHSPPLTDAVSNPEDNPWRLPSVPDPLHVVPSTAKGMSDAADSGWALGLPVVPSAHGADVAGGVGDMFDPLELRPPSPQSVGSSVLSLASDLRDIRLSDSCAQQPDSQQQQQEDDAATIQDAPYRPDRSVAMSQSPQPQQQQQHPGSQQEQRRDQRQQEEGEEEQGQRRGSHPLHRLPSYMREAPPPYSPAQPVPSVCDGDHASSPGTGVTRTCVAAADADTASAGAPPTPQPISQAATQGWSTMAQPPVGTQPPMGAQPATQIESSLPLSMQGETTRGQTPQVSSGVVQPQPSSQRQWDDSKCGRCAESFGGGFLSKSQPKYLCVYCKRKYCAKW